MELLYEIYGAWNNIGSTSCPSFFYSSTISYPSHEIKFYCGEYNSLVLDLSLSPSLLLGNFLPIELSWISPAELGLAQPQLVSVS